MELPPAIIVHGLGEALPALRLRRPVTLLSAPGAAIYAGVGWWRALVRAAARNAGGAAGEAGPPDILDCGDSPGRALEALRAGQRLLVLRAPPAVWADVANRAARAGGTLLAEPPPALDMARPQAARELAAYLRPAPCVTPPRLEPPPSGPDLV